ncbi:MAG: hypothetical protein A2151_05570 [Candidatus Muproteobacteria bacterium RBG_16_65_34]|uniref:Peptidase C39-like domain-containing protein n=1 Tax=Candidatus Muproteobacteria bacterium RBG_16_65_34 TaxID=1817760 RepID=A0A1F6TRS0_9PROT|nr:MAG: hypothetical protein A2151_05570 [Candidatus Muproteobacteria bacterium RBG_16_65_34]
MRRRVTPGGLFLLIALLTAACAPLQTERLRQTAEAFPRPVELNAVPFFPQEEYQCGPAALATVLGHSGIAVAPEALAPEVYLPERQGSLQVELIAAARRHGRVPYVLRPQIESLAAEVASGNPVLVLQNLGLSWYPKWHYAVVVGFDLPNNEVILRSGRERRRVTPMDLFERTWRRGDYWAIAVLPPERLPYTAEEIPYLQSVTALERIARWEEAARAYGAALARWPRSRGAQMGLGNARYALGDVRGAEEAFRRATRNHPDAAPAFNNLAQALADQHRWAEAERAARRAVELGGPLMETYEQTLELIRSRARESAR